MKVNHFAIASNSEEDSDKFFKDLLKLEKVRDFTVPANLMKKFFEVDRDQKIIRYEEGEMAAEVFITEDETKRKDLFTHVCLKVENRDEIVDMGKKLGFKVIQVPRDDKNSYYLFIQDKFGNIYEIK